MQSSTRKPGHPVVEPSEGRADNRNLRRALQLTRDMQSLADDGERDQTDTSCGILYGTLRDMAYKLRRLADEECEKHRRSGRWD